MSHVSTRTALRALLQARGLWLEQCRRYLKQIFHEYIIRECTFVNAAFDFNGKYLKL